jgi:phospholipid N-methyltransferase
MDSSVYARPNKPKYIGRARKGDIDKPTFNELYQPIVVDKSTECHVTPVDVAESMVDYLDYDGGSVLEPSAGTGSLIDALLRDGVPFYSISAVERHFNLHEALIDKYVDGRFIFSDDFLDFSPETSSYNRIIMNPPFRKVKQHINKALSLLSADGILVALVPITYNHPDMVELEILPNDTFASAKVNTKIIRF